MLSALAKYIFGGVMGDAPETTSMQYETREINDWLLVDMPDQDIDNEDMDSESDDDDILTAVPLLLAEKVSTSPRQIVISYEPDTACDKSYGKIRKGFQDKIHSASSKVQAHTSDKIQGNFVANVEAISLETAAISNDKLQHNLSAAQENVKSKSKSKISKPKKSKKNKINKRCISKTQDTFVVNKKKCNDGVQVKPNDSKLLNLKEIIQVSNEIPEYSNTENQCKSAVNIDECNTAIVNDSSHTITGSVVKDSHFANRDNSNNTDVDKVKKDSQILITDNTTHKNADKVKKDSNIAITDNSSYTNANKIEDDFHVVIKDNSSQINPDKVKGNSPIVITENSSQRNQTTTNTIFETHAANTKVQKKIIEVPKSSCKNTQSNLSVVENNLSTISKRSYADVLKAQSDALDTDCNKEVSIDKILETETEFPDLAAFFALPEKTQHNQLELNDVNRKPNCKKNKAKNFSKSIMQNEADMKSQSIPVPDSMSFQNESHENVSDKRDFSDKTAIILPQTEENFPKIGDSFNEKHVSDTDTEKSNTRIPEKFKIRTFAEVVKCRTVLEDIEDSNSKLSQVQQVSETIQDGFAYKNEALAIGEAERKLQDTSDTQEIENISAQNVKYDSIDFQNDIIQNFIDDTYFGLPSNSDNENIANLTNNYQNLLTVVNDNYHDKAPDTFEFQQIDDEVLENIADLWDIYTKIQDSSDDEMNETSDDEMNENFKSLQEISEREMNENSDGQITDDEMNENSLDGYEEISDDDVHRRSFEEILRNFFEGQNTKLYNNVFECKSDESVEMDDELLLNSFILPSMTSSMERKSELLQSFKCDFFGELKQNASEMPNHHSSCVPLTEYELVEYFNFEPQYLYACQSLQYPSNYALAIAEYYANQDQYFPDYPERRDTFVQRYKRRADNRTPPATNELRLTTNTAEILEKILNPKCNVLPTKTAVILEHVKDLKPVQQAIQYEARKYLTRSQLNRQNRNYIYQSSSKTNRRRNLQRNPSGVNNNRKCC